MEIKTLAELKRHLATPNATLQMIEYASCIQGEWIEKTPHNSNPRKVAILQTNAVALKDDTKEWGKSWLWFGKASEWSFNGNQATNLTPYTKIVYLVN